MAPEHVFSIANTIAFASWLLLTILPRRPWVTDIATSRVVPSLFAAVYIAILVSTIGQAQGGFSTLAGVAALFSNRWLLLAGWLHYLAFDLLIGTWEVRDARERGIPHVVVVPCLVVTFMLGPAGWLLYLALRSAAAWPSGPSER